MRNIRRTEAYQAIAIDLALLGVISKEECEMLLDGGIPSGIVLPDGTSKLTSEKDLPPKPDFIETEPEGTDDETPADTVSDGATTGEQPSVDPVDVADGLTDQEPVNDEGTTESDN
jgi:hypothetical protein